MDPSDLRGATRLMRNWPRIWLFRQGQLKLALVHGFLVKRGRHWRLSPILQRQRVRFIDQPGRSPRLRYRCAGWPRLNYWLRTNERPRIPFWPPNFTKAMLVEPGLQLLDVCPLPSLFAPQQNRRAPRWRPQQSMVTADEVAEQLGDVLMLDVRAFAVPRAGWAEAFEQFGIPKGHTGPAEDMFEAVNAGYHNPTNRKLTMVATNDIGAEVATLLTEPEADRLRRGRDHLKIRSANERSKAMVNYPLSPWDGDAPGRSVASLLRHRVRAGQCKSHWNYHLTKRGRRRESSTARSQSGHWR
jgi:hypothetical protein